MHVALADPPPVPLPAPAAHLSARSPKGPRGLAPPARRPQRTALPHHLGALSQSDIAGHDQTAKPSILRRRYAFPIDSSRPPAASSMGGLPTRAARAPSLNLTPRPASENLHHSRHSSPVRPKDWTAPTRATSVGRQQMRSRCRSFSSLHTMPRPGRSGGRTTPSSITNGSSRIASAQSTYSSQCAVDVAARR
jgi:hypothetical protein